MILNAFSILAAFAAVLRVVLGFVVLVLGVRLWRGLRSPDPDEGTSRYWLAATVASTLAILAVVSWPLLYLVLQSYVPEWPGVVCVEGVTRIGAGSVGAAGRLPALVSLLEVGKPALVFAAGAWFALHARDRARAAGGVSAGATAALVLCGALATADGAVETAYLAIPKQEKFLATGCCTVGPERLADAGGALAAGGAAAPAAPAFFALAAALVAGATLASRERGPLRRSRLAPLALGAAASLPIGLAFLHGAAAPAFLRRPHRCVYCLFEGAPESVAGIVLYVLGAFAVGWALLVAWNGGEGHGRRLLRFARFSYSGALLMGAVRLALP